MWIKKDGKQIRQIGDVSMEVERLKTTNYWIASRPARGSEAQGYFIEGESKTLQAAKLQAMAATKTLNED